MKIKQEFNTPSSLIKSVWNTDKIDSKTELTPQQIQSINILKTSGLIFGSPLFLNHVNHFMELQKSLNRKSMSEFVNSLRSLKEDLADKSKSFHLLG